MKMISVCGLVCSECPAYIAEKKNDAELRKKTAAEWSKMYGHSLKPEDIACVGCIVPKGKHIGHWSECEIRACGVKKGAKNCGKCPDYACGTITAFIKMAPQAKAVLDAERK